MLGRGQGGPYVAKVPQEVYRGQTARPRRHVFGHIHEAAGITETASITFLNASTRMGRGSGVAVELTAAG